MSFCACRWSLTSLIQRDANMTAFTKSERAAISDAFHSLIDLCECTNWSDGPALHEAFKQERRQTQDATVARAMVCKAWSEGVANPEQPASKFYFVRPGYLAAMLLGVRHAVERKENAYTGPKVAAALALCVDAIAANDAHTNRIVEG